MIITEVFIGTLDFYILQLSYNSFFFTKTQTNFNGLGCSLFLPVYKAFSYSLFTIA